MKLLIIEDEEQAYKRLQKLIQEVLPNAEVIGIIMSVGSAIEWFSNNGMPDLVFMDVNLADGLSFDIFKEITVTCPIIFTTAYHEYAVQAFKVNSIDYLLKPVDKDDIRQAIDKLLLLQRRQLTSIDYSVALKSIQPSQTNYKERFLVKLGDNIKCLIITEIAYFYTENKTNFLCTYNGKKYPINFNLDQLESMLNPKQFFRINRQFIICLTSIDEMKTYTRARVIIKLKPASHLDTIVSVERANDFKAWLVGRG